MPNSSSGNLISSGAVVIAAGPPSAANPDDVSVGEADKEAGEAKFCAVQ